MDEPLIICDNLVKIYKVANLEVVALQGLDLVVKRGELLGVVGASGSGKSTLMNILGGLDRPSAGRVWVDGYDLLKLSDFALDRYRRAKVGFVWQQGARNLVPYLNALENVMLPMTLAGRTGRRPRRRAEELLSTVGLAERQRHTLQQMSGGEQQRVAIAVALANDPALLLADEPTGEVDSVTALAIYETFQELTRRYRVDHHHRQPRPGHRLPRPPRRRHPRWTDLERDGAPTGGRIARRMAREWANQRMGEWANGRMGEAAKRRKRRASKSWWSWIRQGACRCPRSTCSGSTSRDGCAWSCARARSPSNRCKAPPKRTKPKSWRPSWRPRHSRAMSRGGCGVGGHLA